MGQFRITVTAVGGHGCQRQIKDGGVLQNYCFNPACPDCQTREFIRQLKRIGAMVESATLQHWPGTETEVVDDLLTGVRKGSF